MSAEPHYEGGLNANKGPQILAILIAFPILTTLVVSLRLFTRFKIVNNPAWDDFAIVLAVLFCIATSVCQGFQVYYGMGRHVAALTPEQGMNSLKALYASIIVYNFCLMFTKMSIVLQFLRITITKEVRWLCWALMSLIIAIGIETFFTGIFTCYPVAKFWDDSISGTCVNKSALWFGNAGVNIFTDFCLVVLPIFILKKLVLPMREKISLILILGLGGFASLASILRLHALYIVTVSKDITWDNPGTATWSTMEVDIGIICASLPTLRALLARYFPNTFASSRNTFNRGYHGSHSGFGKGRIKGDNEFGTAVEDGNIVMKTDIDVGYSNRTPTPDSSPPTAPPTVPPEARKW